MLAVRLSPPVYGFVSAEGEPVSVCLTTRKTKRAGWYRPCSLSLIPALVAVSTCAPIPLLGH